MEFPQPTFSEKKRRPDVAQVCHGNINLPSALVLCTLIIVCGVVVVVWIKSIWG